MADTSQRRTLKYIRLAAHLAGQPSSVTRLEMDLSDVEALVGESLPRGARFPSWWRNDTGKMHSRAWISAGWIVTEMRSETQKVTFVRDPAER